MSGAYRGVSREADRRGRSQPTATAALHPCANITPPCTMHFQLAFNAMKKLLLIPVVVLALVVGYFWAALNWNYSSGERAGWIQKLSYKGWVCKTWEGELTMVSMPGTQAEKFYFTVRDEAVAEGLRGAVGKRVDLHYEQHVGLLNSCFGETEYFVTGYKINP
jgi:hypothetical protein